MFSVRVGRSARTVIVQSVWFCSNRRRMLAGVSQLKSFSIRVVYFSFATLSSCDRWRDSLIFVKTY